MFTGNLVKLREGWRTYTMESGTNRSWTRLLKLVGNNRGWQTWNEGDGLPFSCERRGNRRRRLRRLKERRVPGAAAGRAAGRKEITSRLGRWLFFFLQRAISVSINKIIADRVFCRVSRALSSLSNVARSFHRTIVRVRPSRSILRLKAIASSKSCRRFSNKSCWKPGARCVDTLANLYQRICKLSFQELVPSES